MRNFFRYYFPVLLWGALMAVLSSSGFGSSFTYRLLKALADIVHPSISSSTLHQINAVVRKLAHVSEYFVLAVLVWRALRQQAADFWRWSWALGTLAAGVLFSGLDEWRQVFERGRVGSWADVGLDTLGVCLALLLLYGRARLGNAGTPVRPVGG